MSIKKHVQKFVGDVKEAAKDLLTSPTTDGAPDIQPGAPNKNEPVFVLGGEDPIASGLVREWAMKAERGGVAAEKVAGARKIAAAMDQGDPGETFTLRGQDAIATGIVQLWIQRAKARGVDPARIARAEAIADAMALYSPKKLPD